MVNRFDCEWTYESDVQELIARSVSKGKATEADSWKVELRAATERAETAEHLVRAREADVEDIRQAYEVLQPHLSCNIHNYLRMHSFENNKLMLLCGIHSLSVPLSFCWYSL